MKKLAKLFLILSLLNYCFVEEKKNELEYDFSLPNQILELPKELDEISGLTWGGNNVLFMLNDEQGIIYKYQIDDKKVFEKAKFKNRGDFEGIARANRVTYALKSDGTLFSIGKDIKKKELFEEGYEFEGICYFKKNNSLLLACKNHKKSGKNEFIWIFEYDIAKEKLKKDPFIKLDKELIGKAFKPSGIAIHPKDGSVFIISGHSAQVIQVFLDTRVMVKQAQLNKNKFPQIEGICFSDSSDLFIATEKNLFQDAKIFKFNQYE